MKAVLWRLLQNKRRGFIYSLDAILSLMIIVGLTSSLIILQNKAGNLNNVFLYQLAQDAIEVCSKKNDLSPECFEILKKVNSKIDFCLENCDNYKILIKRNYPEKFELGISLEP